MTGISIVESWTGNLTVRAADTLTIDVPVNLPKGADVDVSDGFRGSYLSTAGNRVHFEARPRPLSWRSPGEACLVARWGGVRQSRRFRLCSIVVSAPSA